MTTHASSSRRHDNCLDVATDQHSDSPQTYSPDLPEVTERLDNPASFHFPTLQLDGSPEALQEARSPPRRFSTPPAALSTLGAKAFMASRDYAGSFSSLADSQYDMIQHDELSDRDNDCDTASIASTTSKHSDDDDDDDCELVEAEVPYPTQAPYADHIDVNKLMDSIGDSLETPRQSTVTTFRPKLTDNLNRATSTTCVWGDSANEDEGFKETKTKDDVDNPSDTELLNTGGSSKVKESSFPSLKIISTVMVLLVFAGTQLSRYIAHSTALSEHAIKRQTLMTSIDVVSNMSDYTKIFVLDHLLPAPELSTTELWGMTYHTYHTQQDVRFQTFLPNHFVVSIPATSRFFTPRLEAADVHRSGLHLASNLTELAPGVHHIVFDAEQAYGLITLDMDLKHSVPKSSASHHFGSRILQRHTYEKVTTDLSRTVGERGLVARKNALTMTGKLQHRITVGAAATHNATKQLAVYVAHDLQAMANNTMIAVAKAQQAGKDLIVAEQKGLTIVGESIKHVVTITANQTARAFMPARKMIKGRLRVAIDRTVAIRERVYHAFDRKASKKVLAPHPQHNLAVRKAERQIARTARHVERETRKREKTVAREGRKKECVQGVLAL